MYVGGGAVPIGDQAPLVLYDAQLAAYDPTMIGLAFPTDLMLPPAFPYWVAQLNAVAVGNPQDGGLRQKVAGPVLLGLQPAEEAGTFRSAEGGGKRCP